MLTSVMFLKCWISMCIKCPQAQFKQAVVVIISNQPNETTPSPFTSIIEYSKVGICIQHWNLILKQRKFVFMVCSYWTYLIERNVVFWKHSFWGSMFFFFNGRGFQRSNYVKTNIPYFWLNRFGISILVKNVLIHTFSVHKLFTYEQNECI